jgi:hypothetical protein
MTCRAYLLIGLLLILLATAASADTIPSTVTQSPAEVEYYDWINSWATHTHATAAEACGHATVDQGKNAGDSCRIISSSPEGEPAYRCVSYTEGNCYGGSGPFHDGLSKSTRYTCNGEVVPSGTQCTSYSCPSGYTLSADQLSCTRTSPCEARAGTDATDQGYFIDGIPSTACHNGCTSQLKIDCNGTICDTPTIQVIMRIVNGKETYFTKGQYVYPQSTESCTGSGPQVIPLPPQSCGANQTQGYINGVFTCIDNDTNKPVDPKPPQETTTTETTQTNPDGSTTTTTTTTNSNGTSSTTTETTNPDGSTTTTTTGSPQNEVDDFCRLNPTAAICAKSEASGGSTCTESPTCNGDPIQCSILRQQWENRCQAEKIKEGTDYLKPAETTIELPDDPLGDGTNADLAPGQVEVETDVFQSFQEHREVYLNFSSECIGEWSFEFKGRTYTFDLSVVCQLAIFAKLMLHLLAYLFVARLIHKTIV